MTGIIAELIRSSRRPLVMGILNATVDSFSGDGTTDCTLLTQKARKMVEDGADILDIGGESSRPFAQPISTEVEISRVIPVIRELAQEVSVPISVDTYHPETAEAAVKAGATIINDITGMISPQMRQVAAEYATDVVIMHMKGSPANMQKDPQYDNVVEEIEMFFKNRVSLALNADIPPEKIVLDPGIGFGKTLDHNLSIFHSIKTFKRLGFPILIGASRKSFIGKILDVQVHERLAGSLAAVAAGFWQGTDIFRVHDVRETVQFLTVLTQLQTSLSKTFSVESMTNE